MSIFQKTSENEASSDSHVMVPVEPDVFAGETVTVQRFKARHREKRDGHVGRWPLSTKKAPLAQARKTWSTAPKTEEDGTSSPQSLWNPPFLLKVELSSKRLHPAPGGCAWRCVCADTPPGPISSAQANTRCSTHHCSSPLFLFAIKVPGSNNQEKRRIPLHGIAWHLEDGLPSGLCHPLPCSLDGDKPSLLRRRC